MALFTRFRHLLSSAGIIVRSSAAASEASQPTITSGSGVPLAAAPDGSVYLRTSTAADTVLYVRANSAWVAIESSSDDIDAAATFIAAEDLVNFNAAVNHATNTLECIDALARAVTTARSGGEVVAVKASVTGLAGDTAGDFVALDLNADDSGGAGNFIGIKADAGFDVLMDLSECATGEADVLLSDNKASALQIREATNVYLDFVTTDAAESVKVSKTLDLDARLDQDVALTAAGDAANLAGTINHATAAYETLAVTASAVTTARTGGQVIGIQSRVVNHPGDSGGEYIALKLSATDNGGFATLAGIKQAAGFDMLIDASEAATGEADIVIADNLPSALQVREGSNVYLDFVSTDGAEQVEARKRLVTDEGVASGTKRIVGGLASVSTAASAAVTNTDTETNFDTNYSIPANTLKAGTVVRVSWQGIATATNATDTLTIRLKLGSTAVLASTAVDVADNDIFTGEAVLVCRTAGAGGTFVAMGQMADPGAQGGTVKARSLGSTAVDTTGALTLAVSAQWSVADVGNSCRLDLFAVEVIG